MNFSNVKTWTISEGEVTKVVDSQNRIIWQKETIDYSEPFYVENNTAEVFPLTISTSGPTSASSWIINFDYSLDGETWIPFCTLNNTNQSFSLDIQPNSRVYLRADNTHGLAVEKNTTVNRRYTNINVPDTIGGNIMSLLYGNNFDGTQTTYTRINETSDVNAFHTRGAFSSIFAQSVNLIDASKLILPMTVVQGFDYSTMFSGCTSLTSAPTLPAITLDRYCYNSMFSGCTSLNVAPELPATTLGERCYESMFSGCTSLYKTPSLPATTLSIYCYAYMFRNCTYLQRTSVLPAATLVTGCYSYMFAGCSSVYNIECYAIYGINKDSSTLNWLNGVSEWGNFRQYCGASWPTGTSGIPSGWNVDCNIP